MSISLWLKNVFLTILQPGIVLGLFPYLISRNHVFDKNIFYVQILGFLILTIGLIFLLITIYQLALQGQGTLSPIAPTKVLAYRGVYQYSRNPMYISVIIVLIGMSLCIQDLKMIFYTFGITMIFHVFVVFREEPRLHNAFGQSYTDYQSKVRRWL